MQVQRRGRLTVNRRAGKYFMNKAFKSEQEQLLSNVGRLGLITASLERCTQLEARPSHEIGPGDRHSPLNDIMRLVRQENTVLCLTEELCVCLSIQRRLWPKQNADRDINNPQSEPLCTRDDINKTVNIKSAQRE